MRESRNPFRLRRSENIDTNATFLTLFEPGILEVLGDGGLPTSVQPIRSAAGGGKTSILRLFTPQMLQLLHRRRYEEQTKELHQRLVTLGVLDDNGPKLLGVMLLCGRNYSVLQDLPVEQIQRDRLFFGLLNARIILAVLRTSLAFRGYEYPNDLEKIRLVSQSEVDIPTSLNLPCSGAELYEWARNVEKSICDVLDSFGPLEASSLPGNDSLFALGIIKPKSLLIDGKQVAERIVLMMDDIDKLSSAQRTLLVEHVVEVRSHVGVFIAERFDALSTQEMLAVGSAEGRDHQAPIELERYWRKKYDRLEKYVMRIADRRVQASTERETHSYRASLEDDLSGQEWEPIFQRAYSEISGRVRDRINSNGRFAEWLKFGENITGTPQECALAWRSLEILVEREMKRPQKGLFDDVTILDEDELSEKNDSQVKNAAELFLAREYKLPYYFGPDRVARLASLNIQQFLGLGGNLFEEIISAELLRGETAVLPAKRQHALLKKAALSYWNDIPNNVRFGRELRAFLDSVGKFSAWYTYRPTAPNDYGVGGTAIRMTERDLLLDKQALEKRPDRKLFADLLASALAHNYLIADLDYKCKGDRWMVLNLNRLLCVHFDLPLGYGLYKERPLEELCRWIDKPFIEPKNQEFVYEQ